MGIWSSSFYGNDNALDFLEELPQKGIRRWQLALRQNIQSGLKRVRSPLSAEQIEKELAVMLKQHQVHLLEGRKVGSLEEYERRWRRIFANENNNRDLTELLEYACAVDLLASFTISQISSEVPEEVVVWLTRNSSMITKKSAELIELCLTSWAEILAAPELMQPVLGNLPSLRANISHNRTSGRL